MSNSKFLTPAQNSPVQKFANNNCQRAPKRGQLDKEESVDFYKRYFVTLFEESPMPNWLSMDKTQGIMQLFASGMSQRQIARALRIDRKSVAGEWRRSGAKGTTDGKAPTGSVTDNE
jgi:DNA-binding CsgD family transcriptional regulator